MRKEFLFFLIFLLLGCLETQYEVGCCSQINDPDPNDGIPGQCEYVWNGTHQVPLGAYFNSMIGSSVVITDNSCDKACNISISFEKEGVQIEKNFTLSLCQAYDETSCLPRSCSAMVCGDFTFKAKAEGTAFEYLVGGITKINSGELGYGGESASDAVINLFNARCKFSIIDKRLQREMTRAGGFINSFRVGVGSSYSDFDIARYYIPISDYMCAINPYGVVDRYMNYLNYSGYSAAPGSNPEDEFKNFFYNVTTCIFSSKQEFSNVFPGMQYPPAFDNITTFQNESGKYSMVNNLSNVPYNRSLDIINKTFYKIWLRKTNEIGENGKYPFECLSGRDCLSAFCTKKDYVRGVCKNIETGENPSCECRAYPEDDAVKYYGDNYEPDYYYIVCDAYNNTTDVIETIYMRTPSDHCSSSPAGMIAPKIFFTYVPCQGAPATLSENCVSGQTFVGFATMNESAFKQTNFYQACHPNYIVLNDFIDVNGDAPYNFSSKCPPSFEQSSPVPSPNGDSNGRGNDDALFNFSVRLAACLPRTPYNASEGEYYGFPGELFPGVDLCNPSSLNWPYCLPVSGRYADGGHSEDKQQGCSYFYKDLILIKDTGDCLNVSQNKLHVDEYGWCESCTLLTTTMQTLQVNSSENNVSKELHFIPNASYMYSKTSQYLKEGIMPIIDASDDSLWNDWQVTRYFMPRDGGCAYIEDHPENYGFMSISCIETPNPGGGGGGGGGREENLAPNLIDPGDGGGGGGGGVPPGRCKCTGVKPKMFNATINSGPVMIIVGNLTFGMTNDVIMEELTKRGLITKYNCKPCIVGVRVKGNNITEKNDMLSMFFGLPEGEKSCFSTVSRVMGTGCNQSRLSSFDIIVTEFQPGKGELSPFATTDEEANKLILGNMTNFTHTTLIRYSKVTFVDDISSCLGEGECWSESEGGWRKLQSFYTYLLQHQENMVERGLIGVHFKNWSGESDGNYLAVQTNGSDGLPYSEMKSKLYCAFTSPMYFAIHGPPTTYINKVFASPTVTCVPATTADYLKYCGVSDSSQDCDLRKCDDGFYCTCPEGTDCATNYKAWKCPEGQITNSCTDCSSIGPVTCTLVYQNGSTESKTISPEQLINYPDVIASLSRGNKCCLSEVDQETGDSTVKYTFYKSLYQRIGAVPIVYSLRGLIDEQCLISSFIEENKDFCGVTIPNVPYRVENCH